jgi:hypothetical protein
MNFLSLVLILVVRVTSNSGGPVENKFATNFSFNLRNQVRRYCNPIVKWCLSYGDYHSKLVPFEEQQNNFYILKRL